MVGVYTIEGDVILNLDKFQSAISNATNMLTELGTGLNASLDINDSLGSFDTLLQMFSELGVQAKEINQSFTNFEGINKLIEQLRQSREALIGAKEEVAQIKTEVGGVNAEMERTAQITSKIKTETTGWVAEIQKVTEGIVSLMTKEEWSNYILENQESEIGQINARWREIQGLIQKNTSFMKEMEVSGSNIAKYFINENQILERNVSLLEREAQLTNLLTNKTKQNAINISNISKELSRVANFSKEVGTYFANEDKILRMSLRTIREQDQALADKLAKSERETALAKEIADINKLDMDIRKATGSALSEIVSLTGLEAEAVLKVANSEGDVLAMIEKQVATEEERLMLLKEIDAMESATISKMSKSSVGATGGNRLDKMGYLPARIGSMALTMWGFNEIMDIYESTSANLNARGSMKYFGDQLMTNERYLTQTNQTLGQVRRGLNGFETDLNNLQKTYQKIDMRVIGANAEETAYKYGVQADKLGDLAEVYAVYGSEFVKQGRTQEDSVLAINDALDGEVRRLKEVNIKMEDLKEHGYKEGDTASLIDALNEIAKERGYDITAQNITNLNDAITALELKISQGLAGAFEYIEPLLREVTMDFIYMIDALEWLFGLVNKQWNNFMTEMDKMFGVQKVQRFSSSMLKAVGILVTGAITFGIIYKVVKSLKGALSSLFGIFSKGESLGGEVAKDTGGIAKTGSDMSFGEGFKSEFNKLGKNLGKMARVFLEVAIAMGMAFVLIEEAIGIISAIGYTYDALKPQFDKGIEFIKEYGLTLALIGGAFIVLSYAIDRVPDSAMESIGKGAVKLGTGMAIAMGLIAEAIVLLNAPLLAIASLGAVQEFAEEQINDGLAVIRMFANALHTIEQDDTIGWFIIGFVGLSAVLGFTADIVALPLAIGIATTLGLVAEAIGLLVVPLGAIALLGGTASALGEENIKQGAETIRIVGECLKALEPSVRALLLIDLEVFGVNLVDWGNKFITGKTGLQSLVEDIIPNLVQFVRNFNEVDMSGAETVEPTKVQAITQMATDIPPLFTAMNNLNNAMGTSDAIGNIGGALGGGISGAIGMGLKGKLDQLYNDVKDVMDFATKLGGLGSTNGANASAIGQTANAIAQLKAKMDTMVVTINTASVNVRTASKSLGSAIKVGFNEGSSGFNTAVVSVLAKGISEVQHRYDTWHSGGVASAQKLADGFDKLGGKLKASIREEMGYALAEIDNYQDDFYNKGVMLGQALVDGFKSKDALDQNSPAKITKSIREELGYSMEALDVGRQMMYRGGQSLGQALASGYDSTGNLMTDVGVLTSKGVSSEQLQANAKNVQVNTKGKQQVPQLTSNTFNIDMSGATIIGIQDLDNKIRQSVEKAIIQMNTPNGAIGY